MFKKPNEVYDSLRSEFESRIKAEIQVGSVIDMFNKVLSEEIGDMYKYIEDSKNPHLFTNTSGKDLDSLGEWVGVSRQKEESDDHYKFRLKNWVRQNEASNTTAIENALLLDTRYASNIQFVPYTHGSGTATCYIIPKEYKEEIISGAMQEAKNMLEKVISPSLYVEYIVPMIRWVKIQCYISTSGNKEYIKNNIEKSLKTYINSIAPGTKLSIGEILRLGLNEPDVDYFNIVAIYVDEEQVHDTNIIQELETKLLFDEIIWTDEE